jgi:hypothetical protein
VKHQPLFSVIKTLELSNTVIGFCGDNYRTNFEGAKQKGKNNFFKPINKKKIQACGHLGPLTYLAPYLYLYAGC